MSFDFSIFNDRDTQLDSGYVKWLIDNKYLDRAIHFDRLWSYYQNDSYPSSISDSGSDRPYVQSQEYGLPLRITGHRHSFWGNVQTGNIDKAVSRKEIVIENDIGWRIETIVDFLFGRAFTITSKAANADKKCQIEEALNLAFEANGGILFFQQLALLGSIYGFVDIIVRSDELFGNDRSDMTLLQAAENVILEAIEPVRSLPILNENDYRKIDFYIQYYHKSHNSISDSSPVISNAKVENANLKQSRCLEVISPRYWQRYQDDQLIDQGENSLGVLPVVHIQNMAVPYQYEGNSDVEPLLPLQDELNTRLSDRANRLTFQSFKMYLGKGIDNFSKMPVGPGTMWHTDNVSASIQEFGGDDGSVAEAEHIQQIRDAMEKTSGVAAIAAGIIRNRIGNLTSAVALKITLMGILAKNHRKRQCYGKGIKQMANLILTALDKAGVLTTDPEDREIDIHWPNPLPENVTEILQEAKMKLELGVEPGQVLKEIGY